MSSTTPPDQATPAQTDEHGASSKLETVAEHDETPNWKDVTSTIKSLGQELNVGELIIAESFSLFEAMSAVEIMDPKMDSGMVGVEHLTIDSAIEKGLLPQQLSVEQIIGCMDQLTALEMMYMDGNSLAQTIFTCMYMHREELTSSIKFFGPFCKAVKKTVEVVRSVVMRADVFDEEDFLPSLFGLDLGGWITEDEVIAELLSAENYLLEVIKLNKGLEVSADIVALQDDSSKEHQFAEALLARLRIRRALLLAIACLRKLACQGLEDARKPINFGLLQLPIIRKTLSLGSSEPPGFDASITKLLLAPCPPRAVKAISTVEGIDRFEHLFQQFLQICALPENCTLPKLIRHLSALSLSQPNIVPRSLLLRLVFCEEKVLGKFPMQMLLKDSMLDFGLPPTLNDAVEPLSDFLYKCRLAYEQVLRLYSMNRARQRRRITKLYDDWAILQNEADHMDSFLMQNFASSLTCTHPLSSWVLDQTVDLMLNQLHLGFELELYSLCELHLIYWYLDFLMGVKHKNREISVDKVATAAEGKKKGGVRKKENAKKKLNPWATQNLLLEIHQNISRGLYRLLSALIQDQRLPMSKPQQESLATRFEHRFKMFRRLHQPQALFHSDFERSNQLDPDVKTEKVYSSASDCFRVAKAGIEQLLHREPPLPQTEQTHLQDLARLVVTNTVTMSLLQRDANLKLDFQMNAVGSFLLVKLKGR